MEQVSKVKTHEGFLYKYKHKSALLKCDMHFNIFLPFTETQTEKKWPSILFLSGLTCTPDNFFQKSGCFQYATKQGLILIAPDTSPRGLNLPGDKDCFDLGEGAGWYIDAVEGQWQNEYKMYSYLTQELYSLLIKYFPMDPNLISLMGHSMGGHGALTIYLKNPKMFQSCSVFAPICHPSVSHWGKKALTAFLGSDLSKWKQNDATEVMKQFNLDNRLNIFLDQGTKDEYLEEELRPHDFISVCEEKKERVDLRVAFRDGYDHSYYYISTFIREHFDYHVGYLNNK